MAGTAFKEKLDADALAYFVEVSSRPFAQQAVAFLNAYWPEIGGQAEFIFTVSWEILKNADMHNKGVQLIHLYDEGMDVDFDIALYFYEQLVKFLDDDKNSQWTADEWKLSQPEMLTAIKRKQELRDKVDVNFDGRMSFLEFLLYQYREFCSPGDFVKRSMGQGDEHPEIRKARLALEEVNERIRAYEAEKSRLEAEAALPGVKGLRAKNMLAQLGASPLAEALNTALIKAEAALRRAQKLFGGGRAPPGEDGQVSGPSDGALWWMSKDLAIKKARYGR